MSQYNCQSQKYPSLRFSSFRPLDHSGQRRFRIDQASFNGPNRFRFSWDRVCSDSDTMLNSNLLWIFNLKSTGDK